MVVGRDMFEQRPIPLFWNERAIKVPCRQPVTRDRLLRLNFLSRNLEHRSCAKYLLLLLLARLGKFLFFVLLKSGCRRDEVSSFGCEK